MHEFGVELLVAFEDEALRQLTIDAGAGDDHSELIDVRRGGEDQRVSKWAAEGRFVAVSEDVAAHVDDRHDAHVELVAEFGELLGEVLGATAGIE
jgi:hypothetical protein